MELDTSEEHEEEMLNITATRRNKRTAAELNIAPLIDMVFILLIFFLVNTSFVRETGIGVSRLTASTAVTPQLHKKDGKRLKKPYAP